MVPLVDHQVLLLQEVVILQLHQVFQEEFQVRVVTLTQLVPQQDQELQVELVEDQHQALIHKDHPQLMQTYHHIMHFVTL